MGKDFQYGGQAVIEGVMIRGPESRAVAVRRPDATIVVDEKPVRSATGRYKMLKWPLVRGFYALFESMVVGIEALTYSAGQALEGEEEELTARDIVITIGVAVLLAIVLFVVLPVGASHLLSRWVQGSMAQNALEGVLRIVVFLLYLVAISFLPDIRRVFQYHGAEHKVINAYEAGEELTVAAVQRHSTFHPRCGTSFILIVLVVSILVFSLLGEQVLWWRILSRILLLPVVAGLSYEILKLSAKYEKSPLFQLVIAPGKWLQGMTTRQPEDGQVEVAITALGAVLRDNRSDEAHVRETG